MKKIILSTLLLSAFSAFANEAADDAANRAAHAGSMTRAEVRADYLGAKAAGTIADTSEAASMKSQGASALPRGSLKAQAMQAAKTRIVHELM